MTKRRFTPAYPAEFRERGVRLFRENRACYTSDTAGFESLDQADTMPSRAKVS
jgi:hypothetical protein